MINIIHFFKSAISVKQKQGKATSFPRKTWADREAHGVRWRRHGCGSRDAGQPWRGSMPRRSRTRTGSRAAAGEGCRRAMRTWLAPLAAASPEVYQFRNNGYFLYWTIKSPKDKYIVTIWSQLSVGWGIFTSTHILGSIPARPLPDITIRVAGNPVHCSAGSELLHVRIVVEAEAFKRCRTPHLSNFCADFMCLLYIYIYIYIYI